MIDSASTVTGVRDIDPGAIRKNPNNPRRYFNEEQLDLLRTSIQEVGVLVPLIVFAEDNGDHFVLMDGERRWVCALDLGLESVPANVIPPPTPLENLLRMFNIHAVREEWPLISEALSLREVIRLSGETREGRLAELTGLTRGTVRRAKRLLQLPEGELSRIQAEAHLDRNEQIHREDLYLEIEAAASVLLNDLPEIRDEYSRDDIIRRFAMKREAGTLRAFTEFRDVGKLMKALQDGLVKREQVLEAARRLLDDVQVTPSQVFNEIGAMAYRQSEVSRKAELLAADLRGLEQVRTLPGPLREILKHLREEINRLLARR